MGQLCHMSRQSSRRARFAGDLPNRKFVPLRGWDKGTTLGLLECISKLQIEEIKEYALDALEFADRHLEEHGGKDPHGLTSRGKYSSSVGATDASVCTACAAGLTSHFGATSSFACDFPPAYTISGVVEDGDYNGLYEKRSGSGCGSGDDSSPVYQHTSDGDLHLYK